MSGLTADARTLIDHARVEGQNYRFTYDEAISVESLTHAVCDLALRFGEDRDDDNAMVSDSGSRCGAFAFMKIIVQLTWPDTY